MRLDRCSRSFQHFNHAPQTVTVPTCGVMGPRLVLVLGFFVRFIRLSDAPILEEMVYADALADVCSAGNAGLGAGAHSDDAADATVGSGACRTHDSRYAARCAQGCGAG